MEVDDFDFDEGGLDAAAFDCEVDFEAEAVAVEDDLREIGLVVVLFVVELLVPSDWRRGGLKGKRLRFA